MARRSLPLLGLLILPLVGCARGGPEGGGAGPNVPDRILRFIIDFGAAIDETSFYYIAIDADDDFGADGPLPVAAGPFWGNGWGAGSITHFIGYHQGRYDVFLMNRQLDLLTRGGGIVRASGSPDETDTGRYTLTVGAVSLGAATLSGPGAIASVTNDSDQNAGRFSIETDAQGRTVAGAVSFAPEADGGRPPSPAEKAALAALNAGGVALAADSLAAFGLTLTIGAPAAGVQTIDVAAATATVKVVFTPTASGKTRQSQGTLRANSSMPTANPPIPGATITTETLATGGVAAIQSETAPTATLLGPPYESEPPVGGSTLDVTIDVATLGQGIDNVSVNFIATTELIFDPIVTDPDLNVYDALGVVGNEYVTFSVRQTRTILNGERFDPEAGGDLTLRGPATPTEKDAVDILDWTIRVARLSG